MPSSSIKNGYSLVPWLEPRYLTMRSRRVETWSSHPVIERITASETYSSSPCRVSVPSPRSPVMTAVTPFVLEPRNSRAQLGPQDAALEKPANSASMVSSTTRFAPTDSIACSSRTKSPSRSYSPVSSISLPLDAHVIDDELLLGDRARPDRSRAKPRSSRGPRVSSNAMNTPGSPNSSAPDEELDRQERLARAGRAADQRRPATRESAAGDLVESRDAGAALGNAAGRPRVTTGRDATARRPAGSGGGDGLRKRTNYPTCLGVIQAFWSPDRVAGNFFARSHAARKTRALTTIHRACREYNSRPMTSKLEEAQAPADRARAVLIYDGTCGLCRGGVSWLSRRAVTRALRVLPCQAAERRARYPWMDERTCLQAMQLILPDGRVLAGTPRPRDPPAAARLAVAGAGLPPARHGAARPPSLRLGGAPPLPDLLHDRSRPRG